MFNHEEQCHTPSVGWSIEQPEPVSATGDMEAGAPSVSSPGIMFDDV
jgi:hypothetical protein